MNPLSIIGLGYFVLVSWNIIALFRFHKHIPCMTGMMCSMVLGMTSGWGIGSVLAVQFPAYLFQVTFISMLLGGAVGTLAGIAIGLMPVLDGMLAGFMGGMMGPMMIGMFPAGTGETAVKLTAILLQGTLFLLFLMLGHELAPHAAKRGRAIYMKPLYLFLAWVALSGFMLLTEKQGSIAADRVPMTGQSQSESHRHGLTPASDSYGAVRSLRIEASDYSFSPGAVNLLSNEKLSITLVNTGSVDHDFEIEGTDIHIHAKPGETVRQLVELNEPGIYRSVCTLPGHKEAGMNAIVTVTKERLSSAAL